MWPSPRCVAALAQHPRMTGGRRGPGKGLPREILVKHFHLHLPPAATLGDRITGHHWPVGQSPPDMRAQSGGAVRVLTARLLPSCAPPRAGSEDGGDSSNQPSLSVPLPFPAPKGAD